MDIDEMEFPKWIEPHASHISRQGSAPEHVSVIDFASYHVNRVDGSVTVMVMDADEQKRALAAYKAPKDEAPEIVKPTKADDKPSDIDESKAVDFPT